MAVLLEARDVRKVYGGGLFSGKQFVALEAAAVAIHGARPTILGIARGRGRRKTTLARLLLGITQPTSGEILYLGQNLSTMDPVQRRTFRREVQAVFQDPFEVYNPF